MLQPPKRQTLSESIYHQLIEAISTGQLPPGNKLVIDELSRKLNVSNSPVREAIKSLQRDGLVTEIPYAGIFVSDLSISELLELLEVRGVLEGLAVRKASEKLTSEDIEQLETELDSLEELATLENLKQFHVQNSKFHNLIIEKAGSQLLQESITQLQINSRRFISMVEVLDEEYLKETYLEHRELLRLLKEKNGVEAEKLQRKHAFTFANHLAKGLTESKRDKVSPNE